MTDGADGTFGPASGRQVPGSIWGMESVHRVEVLSRGDCLELLRSVEIGRVVFTDRALPAILPVAFVVDGDDVVLRTADGSRLARAARDAVLAFEVDQVVAATRGGWSVVVTGEARIEDDDAERRRLDAVLVPWVPGIKDVFIRIPTTVVTGRRVAGRPVAAAV